MSVRPPSIRQDIKPGMFGQANPAGTLFIFIKGFAILLLTLLLFKNTSAQQQKRLTANWEFLKQDLGGIWEAVRPVSAGNPESVPLWQKINLPHCVNARDAVDPDENYYQGPAWYRTQLDIANPYQNGRTLLRFEGAGQKTEVYIYTTKVAEHTGGYDEWIADITEAAEQFSKTDICRNQFKGKIPVSIRTDNSRDLQMIPSDLSDFTIYGGIYRYLNLVYVPTVSIDHLFIKTQTDVYGRAGKVNVRVRFYNPDKIKSATLVLNMADAAGRKIFQQKIEVKDLNGDQTIADFDVRKPVLWSPDEPELYTVEARLVSAFGDHTDRQKVGFKNAEFVDNGPFKLNGARLLLKGTHRHEDHAGVGAAMTEEMIRTEMTMMKEMGVNFIRLGHYQQSRIVLNLCDSLGIMVWEEIPWCRGGLGGDVYTDQAKRMLTNMIEQHYNHPAVIIWGLGNENDWPGDFPEFDKEKIRDFMKELNDLSHKLDPVRKTAIRRCDFCKDIVDVYSPSIWAGWYRGVYTEYKDATEQEFKTVKHFFHAEWGGDSHARRHSENPDNALAKIKRTGSADERAGDASLYGGSARVSKDGDWSESYIVNLIDWHLKEQETMPWLTGSAYWPFKDFSTPIRPDNPIPYVNQKGVIERDFNKKEAYYVFQSYWTQKPMVHIYGHTWPVRWGDPGDDKMIKVYSNCDEAELFVNGKSQGVKKRNSQDFPAAGLRWLVPMHEGTYTVKVVGRKGRQTVTDEITQDYQTKKWNKPASLKLEKIGEDNGVVTIKATLLDASGTKCLDATNWMEFGLAGDGKLLDDLGTSTGSRKVQAYNGSSIISIDTNNGRNVASISSPGLNTVFLTL